MFVVAGSVCAVLLCLEFVTYTFLLPDLSWRGRPQPWLRSLGNLVYGVSYTLSLLRAPLGLLPYLVKLFIFFGLRIRYEARRTSYVRELLNLFGDVLNLALTTLLVWLLIGPLSWHWLQVLCYLPLIAESIRLVAERLPTIFSAAWQLLPHRRIAAWLQLRAQTGRWWGFVPRCLGRYCHYYALSDEERAEFVLQALKRRSACDVEVAQKLAYVQAFQIVPQQYALRGGIVRDVARGTIFIHAIWTADPWLLIGMALRRSGWVFDPRLMRRPFYYMSGANRLTSLFVLRHAHYSLPYAAFQFGHEIRVARLHCFYALLRWLGADVERKISADGSFQNDQFIFWLKRRFEDSTLAIPRPLYTDQEVLFELLARPLAEALPSALELAERYTYPLCYVEQVLLPQVYAANERLGTYAET